MGVVPCPLRIVHADPRHYSGVVHTRYAPAVRELFASVSLENEEHAQGVLATLAADKRTDGALALTVRKVCLVIGDSASRIPPPPPRIPHANLALPPPPIVIGQHLHNLIVNGIGTGPGLAAIAQMTPVQLHHFHHLQNLHNMLNDAAEQDGDDQPGPQHVFPGHAAPAQPTSEDAWALELPPVPDTEGAGPARRASRRPRSRSTSVAVADTALHVMTLESALDVLSQTKCIQALTIRLPTANPLSPRTMTTFPSLTLLRKLDLAGRLDFGQLWHLLKDLPCLDDLAISGLSSGTGEDVDITLYQEDFQSTTLHLHSLSFYRSELDTELLHGLLQCCGKNITSLKMSRFVTTSRFQFKGILQMIGSSLRQLALHRLVFRGPTPTLGEAHLFYILDDLPTYCPMLEELQVAAERIVSPMNFLSTVLPSLFLTQLELDYYYPMVTEDQVLELINHLPAGRTETLSFGSKMNHLFTPKIQRACQEIGIVVLGAGEV